MSIHHTGCAVIYNQTNEDYNVLNQNAAGSWRSLKIPKRRPDGTPGSANWGGSIFAWCEKDFEIRDNGVLFFRGALVGGTPVFYMYQYWPGRDTLYWTLYAGGNPSFEQGRFAGASRSSWVDVFIQANNTPRAVKVS